MNSVPGMTVYKPESLAHIILPPDIKGGKVIFLTTCNISHKTIFTNGLYQNILLFYKLFECMGHIPFLIVDKQITRENADMLIDDEYQMLTPEQVIQNPIDVDLYIEIGMSVHVAFVQLLRSQGARIVKLYLGNVLNIDTEIITCMPGVNFPHHTYSEIDEIWTSPHYAQNLEYACSLYRVPLAMGYIAPYIWDPCFINSSVGWKRVNKWNTMNIIIAEPNISYQKCALMPLMLVEEFAKCYPMWQGKVIIMNSSRLSVNVHVQASVFPDLELIRLGRVEFRGRETISNMMYNNSNAIFIGHQMNNEYNYMTLELMWKGFPVLHNTGIWKNFGYYWSDTDIPSATHLLANTMQTHTIGGKYVADAKLLAWNYSPYNPAIQIQWAALLK